MNYLYLSILDHRFICPFTAQSAIFLHVFLMRLHVKLMFHLPFHCNFTYTSMQDLICILKDTKYKSHSEVMPIEIIFYAYYFATQKGISQISQLLVLCKTFLVGKDKTHAVRVCHVLKVTPRLFLTCQLKGS